MTELALWDLIAPYFLLGDDPGSVHAALSVLAVDEYEEAADPSAALLRGRARLYGDAELWFNPSNFSFGVRVTGGAQAHPQDDPSQRDPWIDLRDTTIDFQLLAPRIGSAIVAQGRTGIPVPPAGSPAALVDSVLNTLDTLPVNPPPSDYPSTEFVLDLVITSAILRPPFLHPATMRPDGVLEPDPTRTTVALTLPRVKLRISQGSPVGSQQQVAVLSLGASGLDDPGDIGVAQMVTMDPPYAFIGPGRTVGFGFRSAMLDLSNGSTPPAVLEQFGYDEAWTGVYFPEIRLFVAPQGGEGWAFNGGARNLLVGLGASSGVTGDFEFDAINQGAPPRVSARFYTPDNRPIALTWTTPSTPADAPPTATVVLPASSTIVVDVEGGQAPYTAKIQVDSAQPLDGDRHKVDMSSATTRTITVIGKANGVAAPALVITARRADLSGGSGATVTVPGAVPPATVVESRTTRAGVEVLDARLVITGQTDSTVTVGLADGAEAVWTVGGAAQGPAAPTATFALAPASEQTVQATVAGSTEATAPIYFHYDEPDQMSESQLEAYALNAGLTRTAPSLDETIAHGWTGGVPVLASPEHAVAIKAIPPGSDVVIVGHASWEGDDLKAPYNQLLSERRAKVARRLYEQIAGPGTSLQFSVEPKGFSGAKPAQITDPPANPRRRWWRAELKAPVQIGGSVTVGKVSRAAVPDVTTAVATVDPPPPAPTKPPPFLRAVGVKVRIIRDQFIAVELHGSIDVETAAEARLADANVDKPEFQGIGKNPADGIVDFRGVLTLNPGSDEWALDLRFGADPADVDGLAMTGSLPGEPMAPQSNGRDLLGLYTLLYPLLADASTEKPGSADSEVLALEVGSVIAVVALAATEWFTVQRIVWYGGEVLVRQRNGEWSTSILLDIETAVSAAVTIGDFEVLTIAPEKPLLARYKAIGVRFGVDDDTMVLTPVFDSSKGYTIDVSKPGALQVKPPLGQVLRVDGAKIARTNPTTLEVNLVSAVDLGVVALDRCGVRITLGDDPAVELTALGVSVDVPGVIAGSGYLEISKTGMAGRLDLSLVPLRLRISAALRLENISEQAGGPATGVAVAIEVEFPVAIPLWSSGLGLYGLIGLFAMHFSRNEEPDSGVTTKALHWLQRAGGDPTHVEDGQLWKPEIDHWAFGVGALVGTMGSPTVFNMKGVFMLELPGPRLLLMMKANLLMPMPEQKGTGEGNLLAVVDVDAARETMTIGIVIDYTIDPILVLRIPVEAFFDGTQAENWHVYLGQYVDQIRAKVFGVFDGSGYLMLDGDGTSMQLSPALNNVKPPGFAISAGLHVSMVWGSKEVGLYAELAAGFDAVLGFSPLLVAGEIYARGELRLFIVSISASAKLNVRLGELPDDPSSGGYRISGEVCGSIDLFFFEIEGCVDFAIEDGDPPKITIPPLVEGVTIVNRSPALVQGSASDEPVDAGIGNAIESASEPGANADPPIPVVPINAIPVIMFSAPPLEGSAQFQVDGAFTELGGASGGREVQRSTDRLTYTLTSVELHGPVADGPTPATWWTLRPPDQPNESAQLALLSWIPNATPKALQASEVLDETIDDRWGTVCAAAAPPTPVLWTFRFEPLGPSVPGWVVDGEPWPDPPNTVRSMPTPTVLDVRERWRCGDAMVDPFRGILPAEVVGALVPCPRADPPRERPAPERPQLVSAGERAMGAKRIEEVSEPQITFAEMRRRLAVGAPIGRAALAQVVADPTAQAIAIGDGGVSAQAIAGRACASRILAAPRFDTLAAPTGDPIREKDVAERWALLGFDPGGLVDAVVLAPGPFDRARVLLLTTRRLLEGQLVVRAITGDGDVVSQVVVTAAHIVNWVTLPTTWVDPTGPWDDDVALVMSHALLLAKDEYVAVLVDVAGELKAEEIIVGLESGKAGIADLLPGPGYYVAALEALLSAEIERFDGDSHTVTKNHQVLDAALGPDSDLVALLTPSETYEIRVSWTATASNADGTETGGDTQSFWFRTADEAPDRLDPWVLASVPYEGERNVFGGEPLQLSFASQDVSTLFAAHGYTLEVHLLAASANHPKAEDLLIPYPIVIDGSTKVPGEIFSPWEETVAARADPNCVNVVPGSRIRHSLTTIPIPLHPATDYVLDVLAVHDTRPAKRVFRRSFGTSRFASLAAYAEFCLGSRVTQRAVPAGLAAKALAAFAGHQPEGEELDDVLHGDPVGHDGIEPMPVPDKPRVVVWWEQPDAAAPEPTAVVIDAPEPLWRERERPALEELGGSDVKHWETSRQPWVVLEEAADSDGVAARIVRAPGGQRAIVILEPGSRGKHLRLVLRRIAFKESFLDGQLATDELELLADVVMTRAPWEED